MIKCEANASVIFVGLIKKRALKCYYLNQVMLWSYFSEKFFIFLHSFNVLLLNIVVVIVEDITIFIYSASRKYLNCLETRKSNWVV